MPSVGWTAKDLQSTPDDGYRYEIVEGRLVKEPAPTTAHQTLVTRLLSSLFLHLDPVEHDRILTSPIGVILDEDVALQPDLLYVASENKHRIHHDAIYGAPDLVMEVLSPSTRDRDLTEKRRLYALYGVKEYWIVDPSYRLLIHCTDSTRAGYQDVKGSREEPLSSTVVTGWYVNPRQLFREYA